MVFVHFAEGFEEIEAVSVVDVLRRGGIETATVSVTGSKTVCGSHGIAVLADMLFEEADYGKCEMIVLPGGMPGTENLMTHEGLKAEIMSFAGEGKYLAAICAAPTVLGKLGVLKGKKATVFPGMEENLIGAEVSENRVVIDGNIITSRGAGTAVEFSLALVGLIKGKEEAENVGKRMVAL